MMKLEEITFAREILKNDMDEAAKLYCKALKKYGETIYPNGCTEKEFNKIMREVVIKVWGISLEEAIENL